MSEIKVKFYSEDNGFCQQLFKTIDRQEGQHSYYARDYYLRWYTVSDPLGYAELDRIVPDDVVFVICDDSKKELFRSSNKDKLRFPFLKQHCINQWKKYCEENSQIDSAENNEHNFYVHFFTGNQGDRLSKWLLTFKDPELYGTQANDYNENWTMFRTEELERKTLQTFNYCGFEYEIVEITMKHTICGVTWKAYYSGNEYCGSVFDETNIGTMYSPSEAKNLVSKALVDIYGEQRYLTKVLDYGYMYVEKHLKLGDAAEMLLKGNYNREVVKGVIKSEREHHTFFADEKEAREAYKQVEKHYRESYEYPW